MKFYDAIIIGGSFTGLSASLCLGRALKRVAIIDAGKPCNRYAPESHNFLGNDGVVPTDLLHKARKEVEAYPTISFIEDTVVDASGENNAFKVVTSKHGELGAKKLLFASGVIDEIPSVEGFEEYWGKSIIHCPYCHGYEYKGLSTGILCDSPMAPLFLRMISNWSSNVTMITNLSTEELPDEELKSINDNVSIVRGSIAKVNGNGKGQITSVLVDGSDECIELPLDVLYAKIPLHLSCNIPVSVFGCELQQHGLLKVDNNYQTTIPGIYAAGDATDMRRSIALATFTGQMAAVGINHDILGLVH